MNIAEYASFDGIALAELSKSGQVSVSEVVGAGIDSAQRLDPTLNFMAGWTDEEAIIASDRLDSNMPLAGVPFLYKDNGAHPAESVQEMGSRLAAGRRVQSATTLARRFERSGVISLGRSTTPEFGTSATTESVLNGPTCNPWDPNRMSGGSSGGAAAAVAAGVVPIAHGTDGGGSIRVPAHCCGVVGMKPSRGRNPDSSGLALTVQHVITRSVRDSAFMLDLTCGAERGAICRTSRPSGNYLADSQNDPVTLRIGVIESAPTGALVDPECRKAVTSAASLCESLGHEISMVPLSLDWCQFQSALVNAYCAGISSEIQWLATLTGHQIDADFVESTNLALYESGLRLRASDVLAYMQVFESLSISMAKYMENFDVLLMPTCTKPAMPLGTINANADGASVGSWIKELLDFIAFTAPFNVTGQPAISLPLYESSDGLPLGVQLVARIGGESTLFQISGQLERAIPWINRVPKISARNL